MRESIYLAFRFIAFHKVRSLVLVFSLALIIFLPNGLRRLITESEIQLLSRANSTPMIIGAKGNATDLAINTMYFQQEKTDNLRIRDMKTINDLSFGYAIPISNLFSARNFPIIGTDTDYFDFRNLELESGNWMGFIGECVVGSTVADELNIGVGDSIVSSPQNFFDIAGVYPLKMKITGVLSTSNTPDDKAVFVDVKTTWVIMGLGHGHEDLAENYDPTIVLERDSNQVKAGAKLKMYNTIDGSNMDSFHFHGDMEDYPISAIIFVPDDHKSETLLRGRFASGTFDMQSIDPVDVVNNLLQSIFRIKEIFNTVFILVGIATLMILGLMVALSLRLRKDEIYTMFTIGSSRLKVFEILTFELVILISASSLLSLLLYAGTGLFVETFITRFII